MKLTGRSFLDILLVSQLICHLSTLIQGNYMNITRLVYTRYLLWTNVKTRPF